MTEEEAKKVCMNAIEAGIYHDLGCQTYIPFWKIILLQINNYVTKK